MNLVGEVGELYSLMAKMIRDGVTDKDKFVTNVKKELGDIQFMVTCLVDSLGIDMDEVVYGNIDKLTKRQQAGTISGSGDDR